MNIPDQIELEVAGNKGTGVRVNDVDLRGQARRAIAAKHERIGLAAIGVDTLGHDDHEARLIAWERHGDVVERLALRILVLEVNLEIIWVRAHDKGVVRGPRCAKLVESIASFLGKVHSKSAHGSW